MIVFILQADRILQAGRSHPAGYFSDVHNVLITYSYLYRYRYKIIIIIWKRLWQRFGLLSADGTACDSNTCVKPMTTRLASFLGPVALALRHAYKQVVCIPSMVFSVSVLVYPCRLALESDWHYIVHSPVLEHKHVNIWHIYLCSSAIVSKRIHNGSGHPCHCGCALGPLQWELLYLNNTNHCFIHFVRLVTEVRAKISVNWLNNSRNGKGNDWWHLLVFAAVLPPGWKWQWCCLLQLIQLSVLSLSSLL